MAGFIILCFVGFMIWVAKTAPEKLNKALTIMGVTQPPHLRSQQMSDDFEIPWLEWVPDDSDFEMDCSLAQTGRNRRFYGPMEMEIEGDEVQIFDCWFELIHGKFAKSFFQTVVSIKPEPVDLPPFFLRPRNGTFGHLQSFTQKIQTGTPLDWSHEVESLIPHRVAALFQSQLGMERLVPFLCNRDWTAEWTGERLVVFRLGQLLSSEQIKMFAVEVSDFLDELKSAPAEIDEQMHVFINESLRQSQTPIEAN